MSDNNQNYINDIKNHVKEFEKKTACNACSAKWLQSTITLNNGHTHSCHHPPSKKIPLDEIKENPSALHNTKHKKEMRKLMLEGKRPAECQYCWNIEDLNKDHLSDRMYKTGDFNWSYPYYDRIVKNGADGNIVPTYIEVAFDNTCNFKCAYCSPDVSSKWLEEIEQYGPYKTSYNTGDLNWLKKIERFPIPQKDYNPYIEAFWKWWPELYKEVHTFRITGGEPLLSKNTWKVFDEILKNPRKDLVLAINTNMSVPDQFIDKLIQIRKEFSVKIKRFNVFTSCEATGKQAEYIRYGMNYNKFMYNIKRYLIEAAGNNCVDMMIAFNALSITTFEDFLKDILELRREFNTTDDFNRIPMMINYIRWPTFMSAKILPKEIKEYYSNKIEKFVNENKEPQVGKTGRFYLEEIDQISRLKDFLLTEDNKDLERNRKDFGIFFKEYDKRRNTNFENTFPELVDFYRYCLSL